MTARTVRELMQQYWAACRQRGEKPRKVHGLVASATTTEHPKGDLVAWGVSRQYVEMIQERHSGAFEIQEFEPQ